MSTVYYPDFTLNLIKRAALECSKELGVLRYLWGTRPERLIKRLPSSLELYKKHIDSVSQHIINNGLDYKTHGVLEASTQMCNLKVTIDSYSEIFGVDIGDPLFTAQCVRWVLGLTDSELFAELTKKQKSMNPFEYFNYCRWVEDVTYPRFDKVSLIETMQQRGCSSCV